MKPIKLTKEQIEAILNGATMLYIHMWGNEALLNHNDYDFLEIREGCNDSYQEVVFKNKNNEYITIDSLLKIGEEYYVQEPFNLNGAEWGIAKPSKINYKIDGESGHNWMQRTRCRPEYSRIKFKVTNNQVKRVQAITLSSDTIFKIDPNLISGNLTLDGKISAFIDWFNKQYSNQPYKDNLYGFLVTIERIKQ